MTEIIRFHKEVEENQGKEGEHPKSDAMSVLPREMEGGGSWIQVPTPQGIHPRGAAWHHHRGVTTKELQFDTIQASLQKLTARFSHCFIQK